MQVILSNPKHPEYGQVTIPLPLPRDQYDDCVELLKKLEIGSATEQDCQVMEISSAFPALKRLEMLTVNLDELDYLARRLTSFDVGEAAQFQAMAHKLELFELKDLINLTFCCQQATVITDFTNLEAIGRDHYMNLHGGCANTQELEDLDGAETARLLIGSGAGEVTPYGVVYDNGMKLEQQYDGQHFPAYLYEPCMLMMALTSRLESEDTKNVTWLYLPAAKGQIERTMVRSGIADPENMPSIRIPGRRRSWSIPTTHKASISTTHPSAVWSSSRSMKQTGLNVSPTPPLRSAGSVTMRWWTP